MKFLYKKVNKDIENLSAWFRSNSLTLNIDKTKFIIFRPKRKELNYNGTLKLGNYTIDKVQHIKFLGVYIDEFLDWELQIKKILVKMAAGNYSLKMIKNLLPKNLKKLVYFANIQSHVSYALSAWGPMVKAKDLKNIQIQQNRAIRSICNVGRRAILSGLYKNLNILKIEELIKMELLKISHRYIYGSLPSRLINLFNLSHHHYDTRTRNYLRTALHTTDKYNKSFLGKSPQLWLNLNEAIKDIRKIKQFSKKYSLYMLKTY